MSNVKNFFKKYACNSSTRIVLAILLLFTIGVFVYSSYNINIYDVASVSTLEQGVNESIITPKQYSIFCVVKDSMTVLISILSINLLLSICIEKKSKNTMLRDIFSEEILSSEKFYDLFNAKEKADIFSAIETNYYKDANPSFNEIHKSINSKLIEYNDTNKKYIVNKCEFVIDCSVFDDYIEKSVVKKICVTPAKGKKINDFSILKVTSEEIHGKETVELKQIKVNGKVLSHQEYSISDDTSKNEAEQRLGYNKSKTIKLKKPLTFETDGKDKVIEIRYITRVPINDLSYICRMKMPCKKFSLDFEIENTDNYRVNAYAFGFIDDGKNSINQVDKHNRIKITFDDWIFPGDGVAIALQKS